MNYQEQYQEWLTNPYFDEETKQELKAIADNENEIKERFEKKKKFYRKMLDIFLLMQYYSQAH